jgi:hypothetical protein
LTFNPQEESATESSKWQTLIEQNLRDLVNLRLHFDIDEYLQHNMRAPSNLCLFNEDEYWRKRRPQFQVTINIREIILYNHVSLKILANE